MPSIFMRGTLPPQDLENRAGFARAVARIVGGTGHHAVAPRRQAPVVSRARERQPGRALVEAADDPTGSLLRVDRRERDPHLRVLAEPDAQPGAALTADAERRPSGAE